MQNDTRPRQTIRVRGRSFMAFILRAESPLADWLADMDAQILRSPTFFAGRPVILDLGGIAADDPGIAAVATGLRERGVRVVDVEGYGGDLPGLERWGTPLANGRTGEPFEVPEDHRPEPQPEPVSAAVAADTGLIVDAPVRSGQSVLYPKGDVTIIGAVSSGAEITAGGSIHVYGALRGRAIAGVQGNSRARIFCTKLEAELVAIDGFYRTAEDMDAKLRGHPVKIWLEGGAIAIAALA